MSGDRVRILEKLYTQGETSEIVDQLADLGLLREITGQARNRVYRAEELLQAIEEPLET